MRLLNLSIIFLLSFTFFNCKGIMDTTEANHRKGYKKVRAKYKNDLRWLALDTLVAQDSLNFKLSWHAYYSAKKPEAQIKLLKREGKVFWLSFNGDDRTMVAKVLKYDRQRMFIAAVEEVKIWNYNPQITSLEEYEKLTPAERYGYSGNIQTFAPAKFHFVNAPTAFYHAALFIVNGAPQGLTYWNKAAIVGWWGHYSGMYAVNYSVEPDSQALKYFYEPQSKGQEK